MECELISPKNNFAVGKVAKIFFISRAVYGFPQRDTDLTSSEEKRDGDIFLIISPSSPSSREKERRRVAGTKKIYLYLRVSSSSQCCQLEFQLYA